MALKCAQKYRIGILVYGFSDWTGGIDFLRYILQGFENNPFLSPVFLVPNYQSPWYKFKYSIKSFIAFCLFKKPSLVRNSDLLFKLEGLIKDSEVVVYPNTRRGLIASILSNQIDVVLPSIISLGKKFPIPWLGYIFDYQHKYLPNFFSEKEICKRDKQFNSLLNHAPMIIVNSKSVKSDINKFYGHSSHVSVLPFTPIYDPETIKSITPYSEVCKKYSLSKKYFILSNQFWIHKRHITAFEAVVELLKRNIDFELICTGRMEDYRNPRYIEDLIQYLKSNKIDDRVKLLGFISKADQLSILKNAVALIQPTSFEGGPGGGSTYEALAYGVRVILSDIDVNKEIQNEELVTYFQLDNPRNLADKMYDHLISNKPICSTEQLEANYIAKKNALSNQLNEIVTNLLNAR